MKKNMIGIIGCGNWGKNIARNLFELGVLKKIVDVDISFSKIMNFDQSLISKNLNDILNDPEITCVVISTPAITHKEFAIKSLKNNKHIFVEKPFCLSTQDAKQIINEANRCNKKIFVGHLLQYHNGFIELKKQIKSGLIGDLKILKSNRLNFGSIRLNESVLYDLASHDISMILSITNEMPINVRVNAIFKNSKTFPDIINIILKFKNNIHAIINADWISPYKEHRFSALGSEGGLIFDDNKNWNEKLTLNPSKIKKDLSISYKKSKFIKLIEKEPLKSELESLIDCIENNKEPLTNYSEALNVQKVMEIIDMKLNKLRDDL